MVERKNTWIREICFAFRIKYSKKKNIGIKYEIKESSEKKSMFSIRVQYFI